MLNIYLFDFFLRTPQDEKVQQIRNLREVSPSNNQFDDGILFFYFFCSIILGNFLKKIEIRERGIMEEDRHMKKEKFKFKGSQI